MRCPRLLDASGEHDWTEGGDLFASTSARAASCALSYNFDPLNCIVSTEKPYFASAFVDISTNVDFVLYIALGATCKIKHRNLQFGTPFYAALFDASRSNENK